MILYLEDKKKKHIFGRTSLLANGSPSSAWELWKKLMHWSSLSN